MLTCQKLDPDQPRFVEPVCCIIQDMNTLVAWGIPSSGFLKCFDSSKLTPKDVFSRFKCQFLTRRMRWNTLARKAWLGLCSCISVAFADLFLVSSQGLKLSKFQLDSIIFTKTHRSKLKQSWLFYRPIQTESRHGYADIDVVSDITAMPLPNNSFDVIICTDVLEHVLFPREAVHEIGRLLKSHDDPRATKRSASIRVHRPGVQSGVAESRARSNGNPVGGRSTRFVKLHSMKQFMVKWMVCPLG